MIPKVTQIVSLDIEKKEYMLLMILKYCIIFIYDTPFTHCVLYNMATYPNFNQTHIKYA